MLLLIPVSFLKITTLSCNVLKEQMPKQEGYKAYCSLADAVK